MHGRVIVAVVASLLLIGCQPPEETEGSKPTAAKRVTTETETVVEQAMGPAEAASTSDLRALIASTGSVTFRSFGGRWIGMDGDTDLTFFEDGSLHMFEYGVGVTGYPGTYKIDAAGNVLVQLPTFNHGWPMMSLLKDAASLLLLPKQSGNDFVMGNRGGATFAGGQGSYWPFRPLNAKEQAFVLERIGK